MCHLPHKKISANRLKRFVLIAQKDLCESFKKIFANLPHKKICANLPLKKICANLLLKKICANLRPETALVVTEGCDLSLLACQCCIVEDYQVVALSLITKRKCCLFHSSTHRCCTEEEDGEEVRV